MHSRKIPALLSMFLPTAALMIACAGGGATSDEGAAPTDSAISAGGATRALLREGGRMTNGGLPLPWS